MNYSKGVSKTMGKNNNRKYYNTDDEFEYKPQSHKREKPREKENLFDDDFLAFVEEKERYNKKLKNKQKDRIKNKRNKFIDE